MPYESHRRRRGVGRERGRGKLRCVPELSGLAKAAEYGTPADVSLSILDRVQALRSARANDNHSFSAEPLEHLTGAPTVNQAIEVRQTSVCLAHDIGGDRDGHNDLLMTPQKGYLLL